LEEIFADHIAIPGKGGAMENWGLITFGESTLMYNNTTNYVDESRLLASTLAHEVAHFVSLIWRCYD